MAASATFALKAGVWFRRGRLLIISPDSRGTACPLSGRNSTYHPVQILEAGSDLPCDAFKYNPDGSWTQVATLIGGGTLIPAGSNFKDTAKTRVLERKCHKQ